MGKGSKQRPTNTKAFDANYDAIFNKREEKPMTQQAQLSISHNAKACTIARLPVFINQLLLRDGDGSLNNDFR